MKSRIIRMGNSRGVRIPKQLLEQTGLTGEVEISPKGDSLVIKPARKRRAGWADSFKKMAERGDDTLHDDISPSQSRWDDEEWEW